MRTRTPRRVSAASARLGENVRTWRKLLNLTAEELADRAGISAPALRRIESGNPGVSFETVARVLLILGQLESVIRETDPYETDLGRAQASRALPQRVRRSVV
ncbi:helix-turn-helix domain-containing protein [Aeromicrobium sp. P5_D10]